MSIRIGDEAPNFTAFTTQGGMEFHQWLGGSWAVFFSHPKDFTPICTTEIGLMSQITEEFEKRGTKILAHSIDPVDEHHRWIADIKRLYGKDVRFPIVGDSELIVAKLYDMLPAEAKPGVRTPADNATVRAVFIIGPDRKIKMMSFYPMTVGREFHEIIRTLDSLQITHKHGLVTPVNWKPGDDLVIPPAVTDDQARERFGSFKSDVKYLRTVPVSALATQ